MKSKENISRRNLIKTVASGAVAMAINKNVYSNNDKNKKMNLLRGNIKTTAINKGSQKSNTGWLPFSIKKEFLDSNGFKPFYSRSRKKTLCGRVFYNHIYGANTSTKNSLQISGLDNFASVVVDKNILGIQFHPEKSQLLGKQFFEFIL